MKAILTLSDGTRLEGQSFGAQQSVAGTIVFNTAMIGYPESLTDAAYRGKIVAYTYPLIGNYGVPEQSITPEGLSTFMESEHIQPKAIIATDLSEQHSHWNACESLRSWLMRENVTAITGIDTRRLAKHLRENGTMQCTITFENDACAETSTTNLVAEVSCKETITYGKSTKRVALVDCGVKHSQIRALLARGVEVVRVPWDYDFNTLNVDGLFISSGPDAPASCSATVEHIKTYLAANPTKPIMAIGVGCNLLALAAGAKVEPLKYGHHGSQSVQTAGTNKCYITDQVHECAVVADTLPQGWNVAFTNLNDNSCEGICHSTAPWLGVTFTPETIAGAADTEYLYDNFTKLL